jgi:WD40 repeat protein/serine/threonine protein kinase
LRFGLVLVMPDSYRLMGSQSVRTQAMQTCPPPEYLKQFLAEQLSATDTASVAAHLESCAVCRQALDHLSTDSDSQNWRRLRDPGPRSANEPRPDFMRRLGSALAPGSSLSRAAQESSQPRSHPRRDAHLPTPAGYEILEKRGRGGVGIVYKARDLRLKRIVALKMLLTGVQAGTDERARLKAEAEAVASLQHQNIVQIHEIGEQDGCPFLVLEYVEGQSLAERLDGTPQRPADAAGLLETVARAMHHAHQHGVVHRDLKPANILLQKTEDRGQRSEDRGQRTEDREQRTEHSGQKTEEPGEQTHSGLSSVLCSLSSSEGSLSELCPKVTDFGLAKRLDEASHTQTGQVLGTPGYMAPEQARGQSKTIGPAADIYALGAILYQLLTGRQPFQGVTPVDTIVQVLHEEPVSPRRLQPAIPRDLETICLKCLAKEPGKRYPSALELAEDLRRFQAREPIRARPIGLLGQGWRLVRRNPLPAGLLATLILGFVAGFAAVAWSYLDAESARKNEAEARLQEAKQRELAELHLYYSRIALAEREWYANNVARCEYILGQCVPSDGQPGHRGWEWYYLKRLCHADVDSIEAHQYPIFGLAFSPNGKYLASAAGEPGYHHDPRTVRGELTLWNAETFGKIGDFDGHKGAVHGITFDSASLRLASVSADNTARIWDISKLSQLDKFEIKIINHWRGATSSFSPDGKTLALPSAQEIHLVNLETKVETTYPSNLAKWISPCAFSPDGALLAVAANDGSNPALIVWDVHKRIERYRLPIFSYAVAFSPNSQLLAVAPADDTVVILDAATGSKKLTVRGHDGIVQDVAWSPDGMFVATASNDQTVRIWEVDSGPEHITVPWLLGLRITVPIWKAANGREHRVFRGHTSAVNRVAYHPGGHRIASGDSSGVIKVWDVDRDQRVLQLLPAIDAHDVAYTADGSGLRAVGGKGFRDWELATRLNTIDRQVELPWVGEYPLPYIAFSADGRFCAGPEPKNPKDLHIWNAETGETLMTLVGHTVRVRSVAFSADNRYLASASGEKEKAAPHELFIWKLPEQGHAEPSRIELSCECQVQSLAFSADGRRLVAGERGAIKKDGPNWPNGVDGCVSVWDAATGQLQKRWLGHAGSVQSVAFDPKGRWIASCGQRQDQVVRLWDAETGELLHDLHGPPALTCVAFHPDGTRLAAVGYSGTVHIWDAATGLDVMTLRCPGPQMPGSVAYNTRVVFNSNGTRLAVNSWTGPIYVWDARPLVGK